jgi:cytochrome c biogenesis protein CcmG/thiol:disulfide interchange protein DsbE
MRRNVALLALSLCCLLTAAAPLSAWASGVDEKEKAKEKGKTALLSVGDTAPDWKLTDPQGRAHTLAEYRGKVVVLDFWATWCGPCARVMPRLEKLHRKYGGQGLVVFGVNSFETGDPAAFVRKKGYTYTLLLKGEEMAPAYGVESLPVVYVIGADGKVVYAHAGPDHKDLADLVEKQLSARGT